MSAWRKRVASGLAAVVLLPACAGCAASAERRDAAANVAAGLLTAVANRDGRGACDLLAPGTADALAQSSGHPCPSAILTAGLPAPAQVRAVAVYGRQARVVLATDTLFLAAFAAGWRVTAAGCQPQPPQPYDCAVEEG